MPFVLIVNIIVVYITIMILMGASYTYGYLKDAYDMNSENTECAYDFYMIAQTLFELLILIHTRLFISIIDLKIHARPSRSKEGAM